MIDTTRKKTPMLVGRIYQPSSKSNEKYQWIDKIESVLATITTSFDGTAIITGEINMDTTKVSEVRKYYLNMLATFDLVQHFELPTRKGQKTIDHIISNTPRNVIYQNVLPCPSVSDHDAPYIITTFIIERFEPRKKFIKDMNNYTSDFEKLTFYISLCV